MRESTLWKKLKLAAPATVHLLRVECSVNPGTLDVYYTCPTAHGWLELKYTSAPLVRQATLNFTAHQARTAKMLQAHGTPVYLITQHAKALFILQAHHLSAHPTLYAKDLTPSTPQEIWEFLQCPTKLLPSMISQNLDHLRPHQLSV